MNKTGIIIAREFNERVRKKSFIITTVLMPVLMIALMAAPTLMMIFAKGETKTLLVVDESGTITDFRMRCPESKLTTVRALHSCGIQTIAAGDSHNDLGMILNSKAGFLFRSTDAIKAEHPELPALETYDELLAAIKAAL